MRAQSTEGAETELGYSRLAWLSLDSALYLTSCSYDEEALATALTP